LEEGKKKFSEIAQAGNPYDQLLANLKNVATDILNVVNTIVGPIAKLLADNTGLITAAIGLFALKIVGKVFPVLSDYRDKLDTIAKETKDRAAKIATAAEERQVFGKTGLEAKAGIPQATEALKAAKAREDAAREELNLTNKQNMSLADRTIKEQKINSLIKDRIAAEVALKEAGEKVDKLSSSPSTWSPTAAMQRQRAKDEAGRAARTGIVADVSRKFETKGVRESFASLGDQVKENAAVLGGWGRATTRAAGTLAILGQAISQVGSFIFSKLLGPISAIITVYEILNALFDSNAKEMRKLNDSLDQLSDATKTALDTNEKFKNSMSIDAVLAYANTLKGLDENIQNVVKSFKDTKKAEGWWNTVINVLKDITPGFDSVEEATSEGLGKALSAGLNNIKSEPLKQQLTQKYKDILKIDSKTPLTAKTMEDALNKLDGFGKKSAAEYQKALDDLSIAQSEANKQVQEYALYLRGLTDAGDLATKSTQSFMNSLKDSSPMGQMLQNNIKYLTQLNSALSSSDFKSQAAAMDAISRVDFAGTFGAGAVEAARLSDEFQEQKPLIDAVNASLQDQKKTLEELQQGRKNEWYQFGPETKEGAAERKAKIAETQSVIDAQERIINQFETRFREMAKRITEITGQAASQMAEIALNKHRIELAKIKNDLERFGLGLVPVKTESNLRAQAQLEKQSIRLEAQLVNSQNDLANSLDRLRIEIELQRTEDKIRALEAKGEMRTVDAMASGKGLTSKSGELDMLYQSRDRTQKAVKALSSNLSAQEMQGLLTTYPELSDAFNRKLKQVEAQAKASADQAKVDAKTAVEIIKVKAEEARADIAFELEKTSRIISQIGSDTPEKLQAQIDFSKDQLAKNLKILENKRKEFLDQVDVAQGLTKADQTETKNKINLEYDRLKFLEEDKNFSENLNRLSQQRVMSTKETNDLLIKRLELQKQLIRGDSLEAFDQLAAKNKEILRLQQEMELVDAQEASIKSTALLA
ncbi:MAG: hypothetical protein EBV07_01110, partial [Proteobacteria bacterium]|nr:hypothetical protein [Pseudomonadota bacterium]